MKTEKKILKEAFAAPEPVRKKEFLNTIERPKLNSGSFILSQIAYIRKRVWILSIMILMLAILGTAYVGYLHVCILSALMPYVALLAVTESTRSVTYGMAELEMSSRFSLRSITLARMGAIGLLHMGILVLLIPALEAQSLFPFVRAGIYLLAPYLMTSVLGFMAVRRIPGKEAIFTCTGIAVIISILPIILHANFVWLYEEKYFIWWCILAAYLAVQIYDEYGKIIYRTEEFSWN